MAEIADYQIITKGPFTLSDGSPQKDLPFDLPLNISTSAGGVLGFVVADVSAGLFGAATSVSFEIRANDLGLTSYTLKTGAICSLLEAFSGGGGNLKIGSNKLAFKVTKSNLASLKISDVVLWFQRNV
jgi:hypothetical protein